MNFNTKLNKLLVDEISSVNKWLVVDKDIIRLTFSDGSEGTKELFSVNDKIKKSSFADSIVFTFLENNVNQLIITPREVK